MEKNYWEKFSNLKVVGIGNIWSITGDKIANNLKLKMFVCSKDWSKWS